MFRMRPFDASPSRRSSVTGAGPWCLALVVLVTPLEATWFTSTLGGASLHKTAHERPFGEGHERGSCQCRRCAGPASCPCDHGTSPGGPVVCGAADDDLPLSTVEISAPVISKAICEIPLRSALEKTWISRTDPERILPPSPFPEPVDKVPIAQA